MSTPPAAAPGETIRFFVTYSGIRPPVRLVDPLEAAALEHRNTFVRAVYDGADRLVRFDKMVYGSSELSHVYGWRADGSLASATITVGEDETTIAFDADGRPIV